MSKIIKGSWVITDHDNYKRKVIETRLIGKRKEYRLSGTSGWWSRSQLTKVSK